MTKYITQERTKYWPVSAELMAQYKDCTNTGKDKYGNLIWHQNNLQHRDGDKPAWIGANGTLEWWQNNQYHRDGDKPAVIGADGKLLWYQNGLCHRCCGPAVIRSDGKLEWWINNKNITHEVTDWLNGEKWRGTPEQITEFQLRFL